MHPAVWPCAAATCSLQTQTLLKTYTYEAHDLRASLQSTGCELELHGLVLEDTQWYDSCAMLWLQAQLTMHCAGRRGERSEPWLAVSADWPKRSWVRGVRRRAVPPSGQHVRSIDDRGGLSRATTTVPEAPTLPPAGLDERPTLGLPCFPHPAREVPA